MTEFQLQIQKYHYHRYASSPRTTAVHFVRFLSLHAFASMDCFPFLHVHSEIIGAGASWRTYIMAKHILTSCMSLNIQFSKGVLSFHSTPK